MVEGSRLASTAANRSTGGSGRSPRLTLGLPPGFASGRDVICNLSDKEYHRVMRAVTCRFLTTVVVGLTACTPKASPDANSASTGEPAVPQDLAAEVNGVRLHYLDWGGEGSLMLFVPGLTNTAHAFNGIAPAFTGQYRVVGITRRGHGSSEQPRASLDLDVLVDDLAGFIDLFSEEPAVVIGMSYAGIELPRLATRYPAKVRALVFLDAVYDWPRWLGAAPSLPGFPAPDSFYDSYGDLESWNQEVFPELWNEVTRVHLRSQTYLTETGKVAWQLPWPSSAFDEFLKLYRSWTGTEYEGIRIPVLSVQASQEGYLTRNLERRGFSAAVVDSAAMWAREFDAVLKSVGREMLSSAVPRAVFVELDSTYHALQLQRPDQVISTIREFLETYVEH